MRNLLFLFLLFFPLIAFSQKNIMYLVGRPLPLTYNNAQNIVAKKWNLKFQYVALDMSDAEAVSKVGKHNDSISDVMALTRGKDWRTHFTNEVKAELALLEELKNSILKDAQLTDSEVEVMVHFDPKCKKKYMASVFRLMESTSIKGNAYFTIIQYKVNPITKKIKLLNRNIRLIDFSYPENDVVN